MTVYLVRRLMQALLVMLAMSIIVFVGVYGIGDPVEILISPDADQIERERAIVALGLDLPLWEQYLVFLKNALQGDLGRSFVFNEPALKLILQRMPATLELAFGAMFLSIIIGLPLGLYAGLRPDSPVSKTIMAGSILGFSLPTFWVGLMLIMIFAVQLGWLPSTGRGETAELFGVQWSFLTWDGLRHLAMPAFNLALFKISLVIRLTRAGVRETMLMDYVKFARAKGLSRSRVTFVHVFKNILIPVVTVVGLDADATVAPGAPASVGVAEESNRSSAVNGAPQRAHAFTQCRSGEQGLDRRPGRVEGLKRPVVERLERILDQFLPAQRGEVTREQVRVERRLRDQGPNGAIARIKGDDCADLAGHGLRSCELNVEVHSYCQRLAGYRLLLPYRRHLPTHRIDHDHHAPGLPAQPLVVRAFES